MSEPIQPTALQAAAFKTLFDNLLDVADREPPNISQTLTKLLRCYTATMPHDTLDVISVVGSLQQLMAAISNNQDLFNFGYFYFEAILDEEEEKEESHA